MHTTENELLHLKTFIEDKIHHTYLKKYIQKPIIDEQKLLLLHVILRNSSVSSYKIERYILTTMLVQIALDTHELVSDKNSPEEDSFERTRGQLHVLAGDYYSGLYYSILSDLDDFEMIQTLATAIKEINERKMKNHYLEVESIDDYLLNVQEIESLLIDSVANHVQETDILELTKQLLLTSRVHQEIKKYSSNKPSLWDNLGHLLTDNKEIDHIFDMQLDKLEVISKGIPEPYIVIKDYIISLISKEFNKTTWKKDEDV